MPLQNRVTPYGDIVALTGRGLLMGNRGILHNDARQIVRQSQGRRWIACVTEFRGRRRTIMRPHSYTELFFLDEATAMSAGHRPCAECRHADYQRFRALWEACHGGPAKADDIDARLHADRLDGREKRTYFETLADLPDGAYIILDGAPWLVWQDRLFAWSDSGYLRHGHRPKHLRAEVLTPRSMVAVIAAGYRPEVHPTIDFH